mmetsp:Transcript_117110/g.372939  ORF Transcript_117110/g.372939 Transcript_117110/m.372939 type:complete len:587 (-) Transcript_117110:450-2210(-)
MLLQADLLRRERGLQLHRGQLVSELGLPDLGLPTLQLHHGGRIAQIRGLPRELLLHEVVLTPELPRPAGLCNKQQLVRGLLVGRLGVDRFRRRRRGGGGGGGCGQFPGRPARFLGALSDLWLGRALLHLLPQGRERRFGRAGARHELRDEALRLPVPLLGLPRAGGCLKEALVLLMLPLLGDLGVHLRLTPGGLQCLLDFACALLPSRDRALGDGRAELRLVRTHAGLEGALPLLLGLLARRRRLHLRVRRYPLQRDLSPRSARPPVGGDLLCRRRVHLGRLGPGRGLRRKLLGVHMHLRNGAKRQRIAPAPPASAAAAQGLVVDAELLEQGLDVGLQHTGVDLCLHLHAHGSRREVQATVGLLVVLRRRANAGQQHRPAVPADGSVQDACQLAVSQGYVTLLGGQGAHHVSKREQAVVDLGRLPELLALDAALLDALGAGEVNDVEPRSLRDPLLAAALGRAARLLVDLDVEDGVAAARALVHQGLCVDHILVRAGEEVEHLFGLPANDPGEAGNDAAVLHVHVLAAPAVVPQVEQVVHLFVVDLHGRRLDLVHTCRIRCNLCEHSFDDSRQQSSVLYPRPGVQQ